jgi:hypothetical protein
MGPPAEVATLLDYRRAGNGIEFRAYHELTKNNARNALFDSRVMWVSAYVLTLWQDRRDVASWKRFAANVEVIQITSIQRDWPMGL